MTGYLLAYAAGVAVGVVITGFAFRRPEWRRWILWTFFCLRGRRCARVEFGGVGEGSPDPPAGTWAVLNYSCAGCETRYKVSLLFGDEGSYTVADREIVSDSDLAGIL